MLTCWDYYCKICLIKHFFQYETHKPGTSSYMIFSEICSDWRRNSLDQLKICTTYHTKFQNIFLLIRIFTALKSKIVFSSKFDQSTYISCWLWSNLKMKKIQYYMVYEMIVNYKKVRLVVVRRVFIWSKQIVSKLCKCVFWTIRQNSTLNLKSQN